MGSVATIVKSAVFIAVALVIVFFTSVGGYVTLIIFAACLFGAGYLIFAIIIGLLQFDEYELAGHWRDIGLKLVGVAGFVSLMAFVLLFFPSLPIINSDDSFCLETRYNAC